MRSSSSSRSTTRAGPSRSLRSPATRTRCARRRPRGSEGGSGGSESGKPRAISARMSSTPTGRVAVAQLSSHVGEEVTLRGWLYNKRSSGKLHFLELRDGTGIVQCVVFKGDVSPELFAAADRLQQETSLEITGTVKEHGKLKGTYEVAVKDVVVVANVAKEYPISPKEHGTDFLMDNRH